MKIGSLTINPPIALAPMAGVTDKPYRSLISELGGCGLVYTEMVSGKGLVYGNQRTEKLLAVSSQEPPTAVQIFGKEPEILAEAVEIVNQKSNPDIIDLNVGCPAPKVVNNGYGSALMKDPQLLGEITAAMKKSSDQPITVKIRAGWDKDSINAVEAAQAAVDNGAAAVGVHGRTREQFYEGTADWGIIKEVVETVSVPVFGNGDIFKPQDGLDMMEKTGCAGIMIARGARGNPWIFNRTAHYLETGELIPKPAPEEKIEKAVEHLEKLVEHKGEYVGVREMRKHAAWYIKGLRNCTDIKSKINKAESKDEMKKILFNYREEFI